MQIQFLDAPSFSIDINGTLRRQGRWLLTADWFDSDINMLAEECKRIAEFWLKQKFNMANKIVIG